MRQPELTSLVGIRDSDGDRLVLVRLDPAHGAHRYVLRVGAGRVLLTAKDLERLSSVIRFELASTNPLRILAQAFWVAILGVLVWFLSSAVSGPLFAYPWSN